MDLRVRRVVGRYPAGAVFRPENIRAEVTQDEQSLVVRLEDERHEDFWLEIFLEEACRDGTT